MNLTTTAITGVLISAFTIALTVRAMASKPAPSANAWRHLLPTLDELEPTTIPEVSTHDLDASFERAVAKGERAKTEATEALDDMRHAQEQLGVTGAQDEIERDHWQRAYRTANVRFSEASHTRGQALREIDRVRVHLREICANVEPTAP